MVQIEGWDPYLTVPRDKKGYSGVVIYVRQNTCRPVKAEEGITGWLKPQGSQLSYRESETYGIGGYMDMSLEEGLWLDSEGRAIILDFGMFVVIGTYCPASSVEERTTYRVSWIRALDARVRALTLAGRRVIVIGDLNIRRHLIDCADPQKALRDSNVTGEDKFMLIPPRDTFDRLLLPSRSGVLADVCRDCHPTRSGMFTCWETRINARPNNYGSRIDYVLISPALRPWVQNADIQANLLGSDHCPVYVDFKLEFDGKYLLDQVNAIGMFEENVRQDVIPSPLPRLCARNMKEFAKKQSIISMLNVSKRKDIGIFPNGDGKVKVKEKPKAIVIDDDNESDKQGCVEKVHSPQLKSTKKRVNSADHKSSPSQDSKRKRVSTSQRPLIDFFKEKQIQQKQNQSSDKTIIEDTGLMKIEENREKNTKEEYEMSFDEIQDSLKTPVSSANDSEGWKRLFTKPNAPKCDVHMEPCIQLTTRKPGPNFGRNFWICSRPVGPGYDNWATPKHEIDIRYRCGYFKWTSDLRCK